MKPIMKPFNKGMKIKHYREGLHNSSHNIRNNKGIDKEKVSGIGKIGGNKCSYGENINIQIL